MMAIRTFCTLSTCQAFAKVLYMQHLHAYTSLSWPDELDAGFPLSYQGNHDMARMHLRILTNTLLGLLVPSLTVRQ